MYNIENYTKLKKAELNQKYANSNKPTLAIIHIGNNKASESYIKGKINDCKEVGFNYDLIRFPDTVTKDELTHCIKCLNTTNDIDGIILQLPVPSHLKDCIHLINDNKDVDGFNHSSPFEPCTPLGVINFFKFQNIELKGKDVVIIGRSDIVGRPLAKMMIDENATVTLCHSHTKNLKDKLKSADIIVSAVGKAKLLTLDMVNQDQIIIDVGINIGEDGKLCGDLDKECYDKLEYFTPVPKGCGLMTRLTLLENTAKAFELKKE